MRALAGRRAWRLWVLLWVSSLASGWMLPKSEDPARTFEFWGASAPQSWSASVPEGPGDPAEMASKLHLWGSCGGDRARVGIGQAASACAASVGAGGVLRVDLGFEASAGRRLAGGKSEALRARLVTNMEPTRFVWDGTAFEARALAAGDYEAVVSLGHAARGGIGAVSFRPEAGLSECDRTPGGCVAAVWVRPVPSASVREMRDRLAAWASFPAWTLLAIPFAWGWIAPLLAGWAGALLEGFGLGSRLRLRL